ncbi:unnamed protein product, partial [marine sediment metagenome]
MKTPDRCSHCDHDWHHHTDKGCSGGGIRSYSGQMICRCERPVPLAKSQDWMSGDMLSQDA